MERADEVLALGQVDAGLAADRGIDLRDERRRDLDERDAAEVGRGEEPRRVAERPATDRDDRLAPLDPESRQLARRVLDDRQALRRLALGQQDVLDRAARQPRALFAEPLADGRPRPRLGDEDRAPSPSSSPSAAATSVARMPSPMHEPPEPRLGAEQDRAGRGSADDEVLDRHDHGGHLRDPANPRPGRVEPAARDAEVANRAERIAALDQRAHVRAAAEALGEHLGADVEPDDAAAAEEPPAVARVDDRPAAGSDHAGRGSGRVAGAQRLDRRALARPEAGLALGLEDLRDPPARRRFDLLVEIDERGAVPRRDPPPDGRLAAPRQPDDDELHRLVVPAGARVAAASRIGPAPRRPSPAGGRDSRSRQRAIDSTAPPPSSRRPSSRARTGRGSACTIASPTTPAAGTTLMSLRS